MELFEVRAKALSEYGEYLTFEGVAEHLGVTIDIARNAINTIRNTAKNYTVLEKKSDKAIKRNSRRVKAFKVVACSKQIKSKPNSLVKTAKPSQFGEIKDVLKWRF